MTLPKARFWTAYPVSDFAAPWISGPMAFYLQIAAFPPRKSRYIEIVLQRLRGETPIWRYMDLQRFVTMLVSSTLRFTKAAVLGDDPWEGFCKIIVPSTPIPEKGADGNIHLQSDQQMMASFARSSARYLMDAREHLYVNSWSLHADSMAMWKIYGASGKGLAIQSSVERYKQSLRFDLSPDHYAFDCVEYTDAIENSLKARADFTQSVALPGPALRMHVTSKGFLKRACYQFEQEWRAALYQDVRPEDTGVDIPCNLDVLIDAVVAGPNSDPYVVGVIEDLMSKFEIKKPVSRSKILQAPPPVLIFTANELTGTKSHGSK